MERLIDYYDGLDRTLDSYDVLHPDVYGFACTGSSYLVGAELEAEIVADAEARLGCPFVTAAQAILDALAALAVERIALLAPYPADIVEAGVAFWRAAGLSVVQVMAIDLGSQDTRRIYGLRSADALAALDEGVSGEAEALLMSGTGMPTWRRWRRLPRGSAGPCCPPITASPGRCAGRWARMRASGRQTVPDFSGPLLTRRSVRSPHCAAGGRPSRRECHELSCSPCRRRCLAVPLLHIAPPSAFRSDPVRPSRRGFFRPQPLSCAEKRKAAPKAASPLPL